MKCRRRTLRWAAERGGEGLPERRVEVRLVPSPDHRELGVHHGHGGRRSLGEPRRGAVAAPEAGRRPQDGDAQPLGERAPPSVLEDLRALGARRDEQAHPQDLPHLADAIGRGPRAGEDGGDGGEVLLLEGRDRVLVPFRAPAGEEQVRHVKRRDPRARLGLRGHDAGEVAHERGVLQLDPRPADPSARHRGRERILQCSARLTGTPHLAEHAGEGRVRRHRWKSTRAPSDR